jgi:uncharacterized membrane protein
MNLETSKILGGISAILMLVGIILSPISQVFAGLGLSIIGFILLLISLYSLSNYYNDRGIFTNAIFSFISLIIGIAVAISVAIFVVLSQLSQLASFLQSIFPGWNGTDWAAIQGMTPDTSNIDINALVPFLIGFLLSLVALWVFAIIAGFFARRSLRELALRSGVGLFSTAGLLILIGAVLLILLIIPGAILIWIALIILTVAFFSIKAPEPSQPPPVTMVPPAQPTPV